MWTRAAIGVVLCLVGGVFFGQGIGAIHGSTMTGESQWAVIGGIMAVIGVCLLARMLQLRLRRPGTG